MDGMWFSLCTLTLFVWKTVLLVENPTVVLSDFYVKRILCKI